MFSYCKKKKESPIYNKKISKCQLSGFNIKEEDTHNGCFIVKAESDQTQTSCIIKSVRKFVIMPQKNWICWYWGQAGSCNQTWGNIK